MLFALCVWTHVFYDAWNYVMDMLSFLEHEYMIVLLEVICWYDVWYIDYGDDMQWLIMRNDEWYYLCEWWMIIQSMFGSDELHDSQIWYYR